MLQTPQTLTVPTPTEPTLTEPTHSTVNGVDFPAAGAYPVVDPATGTAFAEAPAVAADQLDEVFAAAERAFGSWRRDDAARRAALHAAADAIVGVSAELSTLLTREQGKPLAEARQEVERAEVWLRYFADLDWPHDDIRDDALRRSDIVRKPFGVVAAIAPSNSPIGLAMWKIAPALRAGNTMVLKPSVDTPLATLALGEALRGVLPDGVLNIVSGPEPLGAALVAHPVPRRISFTGSTAVGRKVAVAAAGDFKRVTLELGGNDPAVILEDVDVAEIAPRLFWGAFANNGQICVAVKRVYAHESIKDELVDALAQLASTAKVDNGFAPDVELGPLFNEAQLRHVQSLVADARERGGRVVTGGSRLDRDGFFHAPTIVDRVDDAFALVEEEQFGPALPILSFTSEDDAVARANRSSLALSASVWSADADRALRVAGGLDSGQVSINSHRGGLAPYLPFGGHKSSGIGVENGIWGLDSYTQMQVQVLPAAS